MTKKKIYNIISYTCLAIMIVFSIYKIIDLAITLSKDGFQANFLIGIIIFGIVIILATGCLIKMIRADIYRSRFIDKNKK